VQSFHFKISTFTDSFGTNCQVPYTAINFQDLRYVTSLNYILLSAVCLRSVSWAYTGFYFKHYLKRLKKFSHCQEALQPPTIFLEGNWDRHMKGPMKSIPLCVCLCMHASYTVT
jgi:hypothetical protein